MSALRIVTRGSALALAQTNHVRDLIIAASPETTVEIMVVRSAGDRDRTTPLSAMPTVGVFVKELQAVLLRGDADLAVHSLKDLPTTEPNLLTVAAILPREDPRDVLISRDGCPLDGLVAGAQIATASPRRRAQLRAARPDLRFVEVRGNVGTRIDKLRAGNFDGLILALAGLRRLGREHEASETLSCEIMLPAPGQGAIAIELRCDSAADELVRRLDHFETRVAVAAERAFLLALGGGCAVPVAALATIDGVEIALEGLVADPTTGASVRRSARGLIADSTTLAHQLADQVRAAGGGAILNRAIPNRPLRGKRVLVTRPLEQVAELRERLEEQQAEVVVCPAISISPPTDVAALEALSSQLGDFDLVALTSANGVEALSQAVSRSGQSVGAATVPFAAVGPATAAALQRHGVKPIVVADQTDGEGLAQSLRGLVTAGARVLLPRAERADRRLPELLSACGCLVTEVAAYRVVAPDDLASALARALVRPVAWVVFTSPSAVQNIAAVAGTLRDRLDRARIACIGSTTAASIRTVGWVVHAQAESATVVDLVAAIVRYEIEEH